jgi:hypothetical protein
MDTHTSTPGSVGKLRFHLVGRLWIYSSLIYHSSLPRITNHMLCYLLYFATPGGMYHNKESTQRGTLDTSTWLWLAHHNLSVVDYKALT